VAGWRCNNRPHHALVAPFAASYGVTYALLFGVLPIVAIWVLIAVVWLGLRKAWTVYFTRR
jgi:hypothetical protein